MARSRCNRTRLHKLKAGQEREEESKCSRRTWDAGSSQEYRGEPPGSSKNVIASSFKTQIDRRFVQKAKGEGHRILTKNHKFKELKTKSGARQQIISRLVF